MCGRSGAAARVGEMLRLVRLEDFAERLPRQFLGGQQQRLAPDRALVPVAGAIRSKVEDV